MTIDDVQIRLYEIRLYADSGDNDAAHGAEDDLYLAVLDAIHNGAQNVAELTGEALRSQQIEFTRRCA